MRQKLKNDKKAIKHLRSTDKFLSKVIVSVGECKINHTSRDAFDTLASSIISQQLSAKAANTIKRRLLKNLNIKRPLRPKHINNASYTRIKMAGLSDAKAKYIKNLAKVFIEKKISIKKLKEMDDEEVIASLTTFPGVGRWTAEMFLIFVLGRKDVFALSDAGLRRSIKKVYGLKEKPLEDEFIKISNSWRPYRSIASWYLWRYIDN
tara:strand:- start:852 stop:1472 length:621 start_codon:yes stop_codon:yes gene_type:complete